MKLQLPRPEVADFLCSPDHRPQGGARGIVDGRVRRPEAADVGWVPYTGRQRLFNLPD